ncbi:phosphate ABC transporter permease subunit PstC [Conexibacter sp. DBS9H8]|uniref:phosphate ABC transporter permease subunit PstC n=1 Tax=Conexibacter sp. DBS9H8 TaxID=2937801 RepID=UPI00200E6FF5|nr:phosphate ABC transporter permease subunit PstC [Conexibacter sp. DBS9H8]
MDPSTVPAPDRLRLTGRFGDRVAEPALRAGSAAAAAGVVLLLLWIAATVVNQSGAAVGQFGLGFLLHQRWDPVHGIYGALDDILGTLVSSLIALALATPLAIAISVYLTELAPPSVRRPVAILVELLAAIPSVILGLWGILVLGPFLADDLEPLLRSAFGWLPIFGSSPSPFGVLNAALILTIMTVPIVTTVTREMCAATPPELKDAAYALGATRAEMVTMVVLPGARRGILAGAILGLGRALGEAIAVTQVIGNADQFRVSLFAPGGTLAGQIAAQYQSANPGLGQSAVMYLALILLASSVIVNGAARLIVARAARRSGSA